MSTRKSTVDKARAELSKMALVDKAANDAPTPEVHASSGRLAGLDALRGLMLTIVLADHCGGMLTQGRFIRQWTLMGLGWSDAAEAFVFLSGFTFGWVYSARIARHGAWLTLRKGMVRTLQIYLAYVATCVVVASLDQIGQANEWQTALAHVEARLMNALLLRDQPYAVGILCLYVICLPVTLFTFLVFGRDKWWLLLLLSYGYYSLVQVFPSLNLRTEHGGWFFNPFAWQLLMVCGAILGRESRFSGAMQLPSRALRVIVLVAACAVVAISLVFQKGDLLFGLQSMNRFRAGIGYTQWQYEWVTKTELGPLRLLHFAAMAFLLSMVAPLRSARWSHRSLAPLRACGRHSLEVYCLGVLLTLGLAFAPIAFSSSPLRAALLTALVLAIQCLVAALFDIRSPKSNRS